MYLILLYRFSVFEFSREIDTGLQTSCIDSGCLLKSKFEDGTSCDLEVIWEFLEIRRIKTLSRWVVHDLCPTQHALGEKA